LDNDQKIKNSNTRKEETNLQYIQRDAERLGVEEVVSGLFVVEGEEAADFALLYVCLFEGMLAVLGLERYKLDGSGIESTTTYLVGV